MNDAEKAKAAIRKRFNDACTKGFKIASSEPGLLFEASIFYYHTVEVNASMAAALKEAWPTYDWASYGISFVTNDELRDDQIVFHFCKENPKP